jgi:hypothetical protein
VLHFFFFFFFFSPATHTHTHTHTPFITPVTLAHATAKGDDWWFVADEKGHDGWCPAAFLDPISAAKPAAAPAAAARVQAVEEPQATSAAAAAAAEGRWVRAAYDNEGAEEDELSFNEGDRIFQIQEADECVEPPPPPHTHTHHSRPHHTPPTRSHTQPITPALSRHSILPLS